MTTAEKPHTAHDIKHLQTSIETSQKLVRALGKDDDLIELLKIIHFPGWTTPAEFRLVLGLAETLNQQLNAIQATRNALMEGSRQVGR